MYFLNALLCEHMGLCFPRLFQSWEVEVFYHVFTSRLFLSPTHPQRPYDSHRTFPSSPGGLDAGSSAACQCQHVGQTASLPAQRGRVCSRCSTHCARARISYQLFFFFLWKSTFSRRVTIFSILSSPVGGKLLNWGRQQQQEEVPSFSVSYLPCWYRQVPDNSYYYLLLPPYTTVTTVRDKEKKIYILYLQSYQQLSDTSICNTSRSFLAFFYA